MPSNSTQPDIFYKYLPPERIDVLQNCAIRFTKPSDFNDPFEFRPPVQEISDEMSVKSYVESNFDRLVQEELAKYGALVDLLPNDQMQQLLGKLKGNVPDVFRMLQPDLIQKIRPCVTDMLNAKVGVLCLSEVRDLILMWGTMH